MQEYTLSHVLELWRESNFNNTQNANFEKYLSIALRLYVFPGLKPKFKQVSAADFSEYCKSLMVTELKNALTIFEAQFARAVEEGKITQKTGYNYRSALRRFMGWLEKQAWWRCLFPDPVVKVAPARVKVVPKPGTGQRSKTFYGLVPDDLPDHLHHELNAFRKFRLAGGRNIRRTRQEKRQHREHGEARRPKMTPVQDSTLKRNEEQILAFLGWYTENRLLDEDRLQVLSNLLKLIQSSASWSLFADYKKNDLAKAYFLTLKVLRNQLLADLHLHLLIDPNLLYDFTYWLIDTRGVSHSSGVNLLKTAIAVAKCLYYDQSTRRNWSDIPVILELKDLRNEFAEEYALEKEGLDEQKWKFKELTHEEARQVVDYLRLSCAPEHRALDRKTETYKFSRKRRTSAVARKWQIYLLVKILVYCPVRQEEIRNWQLGKTLFRKVDDQGNPYYVAYLDKHKRSATSKDRHYRVPSILTEDLDIWVYKWRPLIAEALQTPEGWMAFWGHQANVLDDMADRLEAAKQGQLPKSVKKTQAEYVVYLEQRLKGLTRRFDTLSLAKQNFDSHDFLFFKFGKNGKNETQSFGEPQDVTSVWRVVIDAVARSTKALFGEERWTNPQKLRNVAEKHIRQSGKLEIADAFAALIGHSRKMGDEYAAQITSEYESTEGIVDDWWREVL